jgi:CheY-like chemotaxis protein
MVQNRLKITIVGEASTGLEAVQKAHQLRPDLILMDIGLPILNGIEAAREIRALSAMSKILFVSQTTSPDIAEEAFRAGAAGFVAKTDVSRELVPAVRDVLAGKRFVSRSLRDDVLPDVEDSQVTKQDQSEAFETLPTEKTGGRHEVKFYSDDADFVAGFASAAEDAIKDGHAVVIVATESHRAGIYQELAARGVDVRAAIENGNYRSLDATQTLANIMVDGLVDSVRCAKFVGEMVAEAAKCATAEPPLVVICGECAPTLLAAGDFEGAILLEHVWDGLTKVHAADTLCGYLGSAFSWEADKIIFERICAEHSAVL